jgi:methionyl-tRNA synthetase
VLEAQDGDPDPLVERKLHQTIRQVTEQIAGLHYNTAIAALMEYLNVVRAGGRTPRRAEVEPVVVLLALPPIKQVHDDVVRWYFTYNMSLGPTGQFRQAVIDTVNHFAPTPQSYFFAFSTHPFPGFPTASSEV